MIRHIACKHYKQAFACIPTHLVRRNKQIYDVLEIAVALIQKRLPNVQARGIVNACKLKTATAPRTFAPCPSARKRTRSHRYAILGTKI
eukprot:747317-Pelagomonas_calceolata.AAC.4